MTEVMAGIAVGAAIGSVLVASSTFKVQPLNSKEPLRLLRIFAAISCTVVIFITSAPAPWASLAVCAVSALLGLSFTRWLNV